MRHVFGSRHALSFSVEVYLKQIEVYFMKNLNVKAVLALSLLAFSACDKGGGGNNNTQVVGVPGVIARSYNNGNQSCTVNGDNTYSCTETGRGTTNVIRYDSAITFCRSISDEYTNNNIAMMTRQQMYNENNCQAVINGNVGNNGGCGVGLVMQNGMCVYPNGQYPTNPTLPTNPGMNNPNMKSVQCQLSVKKGNAVGDTGLMNVMVEQNNSTGVNIFAFTNATYSKKFLGIFNVTGTKFSNSEKLAKVKMYYTKEAGKADMIKLEATGVDGELSASVTGFAGSETQLTIAPQDEYSDATSLSISCQAQGATIGNAVSYKAYRCKGKEKDGKTETQIDYASAYNDDIMNQSYDLSKSAKLHTEGGLATDAGTASYEQIARYGIDSSVRTQANITTASAIKVRRANYSLDVECKPVQ